MGEHSAGVRDAAPWPQMGDTEKSFGKSVTFQLPAEQSEPLDGSTGDASACSTISMSSTRSEPGWLYIKGMSTQVAATVSRCPACHRVTGNVDRQSSGMCDNLQWNWNGEPLFCCLCAALKGLGRISHFGCEGCKTRRSKLYKKTSWFNRSCKHCRKPRADHASGGLYPRCPGTTVPQPEHTSAPPSAVINQPGDEITMLHCDAFCCVNTSSAASA